MEQPIQITEQPIQNTEQLTKGQLHYRKYKDQILAAQKRYYEKNKAEKQAYQREYNRWRRSQSENTSE